MMHTVDFQGGLPELFPTYVLPVTLATFLIAILFSVQWLVQLFADHDSNSQQDHRPSQGAKQ